MAIGVEFARTTSPYHEEVWPVGISQSDVLSAAQYPATARSLIEAVGEPETLRFPSQQPDTVAADADQHQRILETREVDIAREVLGELLYRDVVAPPEGR